MNQESIVDTPYSSTMFNFTWTPSTAYFQCQVPLSISSSRIRSNLTTKPVGQEGIHSSGTLGARHNSGVGWGGGVKIEANFQPKHILSLCMYA